MVPSDFVYRLPATATRLLLGLVLVGGAGGLKGGRILRHPVDTPMNNLHLALLEKVGVEVERLGDATGTIDLEPLAGV